MGWGDEIIAAGQAREIYTKRKKTVAILDKHGVPRWCDLWRGLFYIAGPNYQGPQTVPLINHSGRRPYYSHYSAEKWHFVPFACPRGEFVFALDELSFGRHHRGHIVIEPNIKARASPNKQWPVERYQAVADALILENFKLVQFKPHDGRGVHLRGVAMLDVPTFRLAAAILHNSIAYVGAEGGLHHAAAALGVDCPAVVIYGGFISPEQTGYKGQVNLFTGGAPCGSRVPCKHCEKAMGKISVEMVLEGVKRALS